jgi:hypothetical protein
MPELELRPYQILEAYWDEVIVIEEDALFLDAVYVELA